MSYPDPNAYADQVAAALGQSLYGSILAQAFLAFEQQVIAAVPPPPAPTPYLKRQLPAGSQAKIGIHTMLWFNQNPANAHVLRTRNVDGSGGVLYDSRSATYLASLVQVYLAAGADFALADWYGSGAIPAVGTNIAIDVAFQNFLAAAAGTALKVGIIVDKGAIGTTTPTQDFINQVKYALSNYGSHPNFFTDFIGEFDCIKKGVNFANVQGAFPGITFLHNVAGSGPYFTWAPASPASFTTGHYGDSNCWMGSVHQRFFDGSLLTTSNGSPNFNASVWTPTVVPSVRHRNRVGTVDEWFTLWAAIPATMKWLQIITGQDYEEGTALEAELSRVTGIPLSL